MTVAKRLVFFLRRSGNQAQFSGALQRQEREPPRLRNISGFVLEHLAEPLPVQRLARALAISSRSLSRLCSEHFGVTGCPGPAFAHRRSAPPARGNRFAAERDHGAHRHRRREHLLARVHSPHGSNPRCVPRTVQEQRSGLTRVLHLGRTWLRGARGAAPLSSLRPAPTVGPRRCGRRHGEQGERAHWRIFRLGQPRPQRARASAIASTTRARAGPPMPCRRSTAASTLNMASMC